MTVKAGHDGRGRWHGRRSEGIDTPETCGRPWPHEREGPASEAQWEGRAVEDREGFQAIYAFRRQGAVGESEDFTIP